MDKSKLDIFINTLYNLIISFKGVLTVFFSNNEIFIELLGVFKIKRQNFRHKSIDNRSYDSLSIRIHGSGIFETDNKTYHIKKGDILYIPKNAKYFQKSDSESIITIHFINYNSDNNDKIEIFSPKNTDFAEKIICRMYDIWKEKKQGHRYLCMSELYKLLYNINLHNNEIHLASVTNDIKIKTAIDYIHTNYRTDIIEISQLADMCNFSETYFRKLFKKVYGVSPQQYIINLKLEFASHLLKSGLYSIYEVSRRSGFGDPKYFSRIFKIKYSMTPKEFQSSQPVANEL